MLIVKNNIEGHSIVYNPDREGFSDLKHQIKANDLIHEMQTTLNTI